MLPVRIRIFDRMARKQRIDRIPGRCSAVRAAAAAATAARPRDAASSATDATAS